MTNYKFSIILCLLTISCSNIDKEDSNLKKKSHGPYDQQLVLKDNCVTKKIRINLETKDTLNITYYNENGLTEKLEIFWPDNRKTIFKYNSSNDEIFKKSYSSGQYVGKKITKYSYSENQKIEEYFDNNDILTRNEISKIVSTQFKIDTTILNKYEHIVKRWKENKLLDSTYISLDSTNKVIESVKTSFVIGKRVTSTSKYRDNIIDKQTKVYYNKDGLIQKQIYINYNQDGLKVLEQKITPSGDTLDKVKIIYEYCQE